MTGTLEASFDDFFDVQRSDFELGAEIGRGAFSVVVRASFVASFCRFCPKHCVHVDVSSVVRERFL